MRNVILSAKNIVTCCMLLFTTIMAYAQYPENSPVAINGKLKVENGFLVNACGYPTQLRGMSTHGLAWNRNTYNESSIKSLVEDWNISLFRIAVYTHEWGGYCMENNSSKKWKTRDEYHALIDNLIDLCKKYGIYCIIDWHVLNEGSGNPNNTLEDAKYFWDYMSKKHKGEDHVLYEICNEPNGNNVTWSVVKKYADEIIPFIRKNDPNTIIICGSPTWSQDVDLAAQNPLQYENIMYTLHFYAGEHKDYLRNKANKAIGKGLALFVTEFGTTMANGSGGVFTAETEKWMQWMDDNKISWANWSFSDQNETSAALVSGSANSSNWTNTTKSGTYIKNKLAEPYKEKFVACTDTTPYYEPKKGDFVEDIVNDESITIYPNPTTDGNFSIESPDEIQKVVIYNMIGEIVELFDKPNTGDYTTHKLQKGIYHVKIYGSKFITVKKLIKN